MPSQSTIPRVCEHCGAAFLVNPYEARRKGHGRFCSPACKSAGMARWVRRACPCGKPLGRYNRTGRCLSCSSKARATHGQTRGGRWSRAYQSWHGAKQRVTNPANQDWDDYGGRGITMCARWLGSFKNFLADMGERPDGLTLERKDNDGDYCPENCVWATRKQQTANRRPPKKKQHPPKPCGEPGCALQAQYGGLCGRHYTARRRRIGTGQACTHGGCPEPIFAKELCSRHYMQEYYRRRQKAKR